MIFLLRGKEGRHGREPNRIIQRDLLTGGEWFKKKTGFNLSHFQGGAKIAKKS